VCKFVGVDNITLIKIHRRDDIIHIGTDYGGWFIPSSYFNERSICYCVGCGEDISFDLGLIERFECQIYAFDPTPKAVFFVEQKTSSISSYHFYELGLWDCEDRIKLYEPVDPNHVSHSALNLQNTKLYIEVNVSRLRNIMLDHSHDQLDLLKIDIEGAEYKVLDSIIEDKLIIKVLCVEFDEWNNPMDVNFKKRISEAINKLINYGYSIIECDFKGNYTFLRRND
jgi:FkbM family methyltransferase